VRCSERVELGAERDVVRATVAVHEEEPRARLGAEHGACDREQWCDPDPARQQDEAATARGWSVRRERPERSEDAESLARVHGAETAGHTAAGLVLDREMKLPRPGGVRSGVVPRDGLPADVDEKSEELTCLERERRARRVLQDERDDIACLAAGGRDDQHACLSRRTPRCGLGQLARVDDR
jgi:hypothetical protein